MNVASPAKQIHLKRIFKEDDYCDINSYRPRKKRRCDEKKKIRKNYQPKIKTPEVRDAKSSDTDQDEREFKGKFPSLNKCKEVVKIVKNDPPNKEFDLNYEIHMYGPFDYLFELRGNLNKPKYIEKTEKIRNYPKHLKYSLFCNEKIREIRKNDFSMISSLFEEIKKSGNKMYKNKQFRESIDNYFFVTFSLKLRLIRC